MGSFSQQMADMRNFMSNKQLMRQFNNPVGPYAGMMRGFTAQTGAGSASIDPRTGMLTTSLGGPAADYQNYLYSQAYGGGAGSAGLSPEASALRSSMYGNAMGGYGGMGLSADQQAVATKYGDVAGMLGQATGFNYSRPQFDQSSFAIQGPTGSIADTAKEQYDLMQELVQPGRDKAMADTEAKLFARGMLGSSGGAGQLGAMQEANRMQDVQMAQQALQMGMQARNQQIGEQQAIAQSMLPGAQLAMQGAGMDLQAQQQLFGQGMLGLQGQAEMANLAQQLGSPERAQQLQMQAAQMGMSLDQYAQALQQQQIQNQMAAGGAATGMYSLEQMPMTGMFSGIDVRNAPYQMLLQQQMQMQQQQAQERMARQQQQSANNAGLTGGLLQLGGMLLL